MIKLTQLIKEETFTATNKKTGKTSVFKSKQTRDAAVKAGTHTAIKEPKAKVGGGKPKVNIFDKPAKPAKSKGADSGSDIKGPDPNKKGWSTDDVFKATFKDPETGKTITVGDAYDREDGSPAYEKALDYVSQFNPDDEELISGPGSGDSSSDNEFKGTYDLKDVATDMIGGIDTTQSAGKELKDKLSKGVGGVYNQEEELGGTIEFKDGSKYKVNSSEGGEISVEKIPSSEPAKPAKKRPGNPKVNKDTKDMIEKAGITPSKLGKDEYKKKMMQAAVSALGDANFHQEARELVAKLEGKPEWAKKPEYPSMDDPNYDEKIKAIRTNSSEASEYMKPDGKTWELGRNIAGAAEWGGVEAADAIAYTLRMNGFHKEADTIQSVFDDKPYMKEQSTLLRKIIKEKIQNISSKKIVKEGLDGNQTQALKTIVSQMYKIINDAPMGEYNPNNPKMKKAIADLEKFAGELKSQNKASDARVINRYIKDIKSAKEFNVIDDEIAALNREYSLRAIKL